MNLKLNRLINKLFFKEFIKQAKLSHTNAECEEVFTQETITTT